MRSLIVFTAVLALALSGSVATADTIHAPNVGIGIAVPTALLEVHSNPTPAWSEEGIVISNAVETGGSSVSLKFKFGDNPATTGIVARHLASGYANWDSDLLIRSLGHSGAGHQWHETVFSSDGYLGIDVPQYAVPADILEVCDSGFVYPPWGGRGITISNVVEGAGNDMGIKFAFGDNPSTVNIVARHLDTGSGGWDSNLVIRTLGGTPWGWRDAAVFTSDGNVGIGTSTPGDLLEIQSNAAVVVWGYEGLTIRNATNSTAANAAIKFGFGDVATYGNGVIVGAQSRGGYAADFIVRANGGGFWNDLTFDGAGTLTANAFVGDGSGLTNLPAAADPYDDTAIWIAVDANTADINDVGGILDRLDAIEAALNAAGASGISKRNFLNQ